VGDRQNVASNNGGSQTTGLLWIARRVRKDNDRQD